MPFEKPYPWQHAVMEFVAHTDPADCRHIVWLHGPSDIGRTALFHELQHHQHCIGFLGCPRKEVERCMFHFPRFLWHHYPAGRPMRAALFDVDDAVISMESLLCLKDGYITSVRQDPPFIELPFAIHVLVFSRNPPTARQLRQIPADRLVVREIVKPLLILDGPLLPRPADEEADSLLATVHQQGAV